MQGHFDLTMLDTPGLTRELMEAVRRDGGDPAVEKYLRQWKAEGRWKSDNLILKTTPSYFYYTALNNTGMYFGTYGWGAGAHSMLAWLALTYTSGEVSYTGEVYSANFGWDSTPELISGVSPNPAAAGCHKRFIDDCIVTPDFKSDPNNRESIYGKFKWLFLPGEATSSSIKSITIYYCSNFNGLTSGYSSGRIARVRLKDSGGNPVTITKSATKSLLIEYTFTLASV